jgi:hypothetical protein
MLGCGINWSIVPSSGSTLHHTRHPIETAPLSAGRPTLSGVRDSEKMDDIETLHTSPQWSPGLPTRPTSSGSGRHQVIRKYPPVRLGTHLHIPRGCLPPSEGCRELFRSLQLCHRRANSRSAHKMRPSSSNIVRFRTQASPLRCMRPPI